MYARMKDVPPQIKKHKGCSLSLEQANKWTEIYEAEKTSGGVDNPAAGAWSKFENEYKISDSNWIKIENESTEDAEEFKLEDIELKEIKDVELFKSGIHNNIPFSDEDIEEIVNNFNNMKLENPDFQLPLTIGHIKDGTEPAVGWFDNVRKIGGSIYADYVKLPETVFNLIKTGAYKNRSIELFFNFKQNGNRIGKMLKSCALLGAALPAVNLRDCGNGLNQLNVIGKAMYGSTFEQSQDEESKYIEFSEDTEENNNNGGNVMDGQNENVEDSKDTAPEKNADDQVREFLKQFEFIKDPDSLIKYLSQVKEKESESAKKIQKFEQERQDNMNKSIISFIDSLVKDDKIIPAEKGIVSSLMFSLSNDTVLKFQVNEFDIEKESSQLELFKNFLSNIPARGNLTQQFNIEFEKESDMYNSFSNKLYKKTFSQLSAEEAKQVMIEVKKDPRCKKILSGEE
jgi:hypothetical protein